MNTLEAIRSRRSIRKFQEKKVPREILEQIVSEAAWVPLLEEYADRPLPCGGGSGAPAHHRRGVHPGLRL